VIKKFADENTQSPLNRFSVTWSQHYLVTTPTTIVLDAAAAGGHGRWSFLSSMLGDGRWCISFRGCVFWSPNADDGQAVAYGTQIRHS
jgi:hypothetical protein